MKWKNRRSYDHNAHAKINIINPSNEIIDPIDNVTFIHHDNQNTVKVFQLVLKNV